MDGWNNPFTKYKQDIPVEMQEGKEGNPEAIGGGSSHDLDTWLITMVSFVP